MSGHPRTCATKFCGQLLDLLRRDAGEFSCSLRRVLGEIVSKSLEEGLEILRRVEEFFDVGCPVLVGASRKSFMGKLLEREDPLEREYGTAATTAHLFSAGVQFIRVHDVRASNDVITMLCRIHARRDTRQ